MRSLLAFTLLAAAAFYGATREGVGFEMRLASQALLPPSDPSRVYVAASETGAKPTPPRMAQSVALALRASEPPAAAAAAARASPASGASPDEPRSSAAVPPARDVVAAGAVSRSVEPVASPRSQAISQALASQEAQVTRAPVARLYLAYFLRAPDYEGFDYYINEREEGITLESIAEEFAGSAEFHARYGELDNAAFVERIHRNVTGSAADMAQRAFWIEQLDAGRMTRGQVMLAFSESAEFQSLTGNEVFVTMAYAETLRREPAPHEFARWVDFLDAGRPRRAVIDALLAARPPGSR